ncbi:MAG: helix-turn-helix domain-containing protein [Spirochaetes bacterium]|nr:MAG: helix-turn-helix domain-containing protein [Spirochaetota bacterium]
MKNQSLFKSISKGMNEAISYEKGKKLKNLSIHKVSIAPLTPISANKIRLLRIKLGISQNIFANILGVSIKTIEAWESGRNIPNGTAQRFLNLIEKDNKFLEKYGILSIK